MDYWTRYRRQAEEIMCRQNREEMIAWLVQNDPNGCYTDEDSAAEGLEPITVDAAWHHMYDQINEE